MVSNSFHRSPSPMSSRPNPNPNPNPNSRSNNQEREEFGIKKGLIGYPFAKSSLNSSAEYSRRSSFGRESGGISPRDHDQKENERDASIKPVAARPKSPSIISKGTKHFMSPTISAASKINPSPRKKILGERNECVRTSASLSDGKFHFFSTSSLDFDNKSESNPELEHPPCLKPEKHEFQSLGEVKAEAVEADLVVMSPEVPLNTATCSESLPLSKMPGMTADHSVGSLEVEKATDCSPCIVAPFDADLTLPPYDPKNNYLSPRPPFLHYNPNRRIESYESEGTKLEDDFTSESVSETENTSEEVQSEDTLNEEEDVVSSLEEMSSEIGLTEVQQPEEMVEAKMGRTSRKFTSWKTVAVTLLFVFGLMSMSLTFSPEIRNAMFRDETISRIYIESQAVAVLAKDHLNSVFQNAKVLSASSLDYFSQMMRSLQQVDKFTPMKYVNLSAWEEHEDWSYEFGEFQLENYFEKIEDNEGFTEMQEYYKPEGQGFTQMQIYVEPKDYDSFSAQDVEMEEESDSEEDEDSVIEVDTFTLLQSLQTHEDDQTSVEEAELMDLEENPVVEEAALVDEPNNTEGKIIVEVMENPVVEKASSVDEPIDDAEVEVKVELMENPVVEKAPSIDEPTVAEVEIEAEAPETPSQEVGSTNTKMTESSHIPETEPQITTANELPENEDTVKAEMPGSVSDSVVLTATKENSLLEQGSEKISIPIAAAVALILVTLFAYFMYTKPKKVTLLADEVIPENNNDKHAASNMENMAVRETPSSWNNPVEVDMIGNSCPTEMSSFEVSTSVETKQRGGDEAHSLQRSSKRNYKRESLVSSSSDYTMDSAYGSFTTYSVIHPKHRDDEVVTPVRRSSRIRSKVTSP